MKELSPKQRRILEFIQGFIDEHDYPPSIRQIQEACDISSTSVVDYNLRILEKQGYIRRDRGARLQRPRRRHGGGLAQAGAGGHAETVLPRGLPGPSPARQRDDAADPPGRG